MAKKRGNNEGSIYFHKPSKKWCAQVSLEGRRLTHYAKTQRECREWIRETLAKIDSGLTYQGANLTVGNYLREWLETIRPTLRQKTWNQYSQVCKQHIIPMLGEVRLIDLRPNQIQSLYSAKLEEGKSVRTVRLIHSVFRRALNQSLAWGLIGRNPIKGVRQPKALPNEMKYYTEDQVRTLLSAVEGTRYEALYYLAVLTGLRQGELLGLKWQDIDWNNLRFEVKRQLQRETGAGLVFKEPKSRAGKRSIVLGKLAIELLHKHKDLQVEQKTKAGDKWKENGLIFPSSIGTPHTPRNMLRHFDKVIQKAGLPKIRFHDLRHTAATLMFSQGVHPKIVQERLGHSSIAVTLDIYSHVIPSMQEDVAEKVDRLFR